MKKSKIGLVDPSGVPLHVPRQADLAEKKGELVPFKSGDPRETLAVIGQAASDPKCDPAKMKVLHEIYQAVESRSAQKAFVAAYSDLQDELPVINAKGKIVIEKAGRVIQSTRYATYEDIQRVCKPVLRKHGFVLWTEPDFDETGRIIVIGHLEHRDGHSIRCRFVLPLDTSGSKNNVQGAGASITYGKRYCWLTLTGITSNAREDRDDEKNINGTAVEIVTPDQAQMLKARIAETTVTEKIFCKVYGIAAVVDLPASAFSEAMTRLEAKRGSREAAARNQAARD